MKQTYSSALKINQHNLKMKLKRHGYLLFLLPVLIPFTGYLAAQHLGYDNLFAFATVIFTYLIIPVLDALIGKDPQNPMEQEVADMSQERWYSWLVASSVPIAILSLTGGLYLFHHWAELSAIGKLGLLLSFGVIHTGIMINSAHELIHKPSKLEQRMGGILLSMVCYPSFKIEHIRGHHVNVATPADHSTSRYGQTLYQFLPHALANNFRTGWQLEAQLLKRRNLPVISWHNELVRWYALTAAIAVCCTLAFGFSGLAFFLAQGLLAITLLETVNYLEHYGLERKLKENGRYERTTHQHSWNSNYLLTNLITFQLQRHSDHHANPQRRYQVLRHFDDSPQLPAGYAAMVLLAMIPPLWMRVMNPRVDRYYQHSEPHNDPG